VPEGTQVDKGRCWHVCHGDALTPSGCFTEDNKRLNLQENYVKDGYEITCKLNANGQIVFVTTGCVEDDGAHHPAGSSWNRPGTQGFGFWLTCQADGDNVSKVIGGCVTAGGKRLNVGENTPEGGTRFECQKTAAGGVSFNAVGNA